MGGPDQPRGGVAGKAARVQDALGEGGGWLRREVGARGGAEGCGGGLGFGAGLQGREVGEGVEEVGEEHGGLGQAGCPAEADSVRPRRTARP